MSLYETDIKPLKKRFWVAAVLVLVVATVSVSLIRTRRLLEKTQSEMLKAKSGLTRVREASANRTTVLATLKSQYMQNAGATSPERLVYGKIDELKARLNPDDVTISAIEKKEGEVSLQYSFKFTNPNYNDFLNTVSYLEGSVFPLTVVNSVAISQADAAGKGALSGTVSGRVVTSEKIKP
jgi:hypothetical protein